MSIGWVVPPGIGHGAIDSRTILKDILAGRASACIPSKDGLGVSRDEEECGREMPLKRIYFPRLCIVLISPVGLWHFEKLKGTRRGKTRRFRGLSEYDDYPDINKAASGKQRF